MKSARCLVVVLAAFLLGMPLLGQSEHPGKPEPLRTPSPNRPVDVQLLLKQLHDRQTRISQAYFTLARQATVDHLPYLHRALQQDRTDYVRWRVARVVGEIRSDSSVAPLCAALKKDESPWVRWAAARALADVGSRQAVEDLIKAMKTDSDLHVRKRAAASLNVLGGRRAVRALEGALEEERDIAVRRTLQWLLDRRDRLATFGAPIHPGEVTEGSLKGTLYKVYVPRDYNRRNVYKLLVAVHGTDGTPDAYMRYCRQDADRHGCVVLGPWFDYPTFFNFDNMNLGNTGLGKDRTDLRLLEIIDALSKRVRIEKDRLLMVGQSRGGQFVQRFILAHPERVRRAAACASGCYVLPDTEDIFPFGTKANPFAPDLADLDFGQLIQTPMAVVIGTADLPRRLEQADRFMKAARAYADKHGIRCKIEYFTVPDGPHWGKTNYPPASRFLFAESG